MEKPPKVPNVIDRHVGRRVRMFRLRAGLSQERLGEHLGVTFQQVQKYENATNRIGAGRLVMIANALGVPVGSLFEGLDGAIDSVVPDTITALMSSNDGVALTHAFTRLPLKQRRNVVMMVQTLADGHVEMQNRAKQVA